MSLHFGLSEVPSRLLKVFFKDKFAYTFCFLTHLSIDFFFHINVLFLHVCVDHALNNIGRFHICYSAIFVYSHGPQNTKVVVL